MKTNIEEYLAKQKDIGFRLKVLEKAISLHTREDGFYGLDACSDIIANRLLRNPEELKSKNGYFSPYWATIDHPEIYVATPLNLTNKEGHGNLVDKLSKDRYRYIQYPVEGLIPEFSRDGYIRSRIIREHYDTIIETTSREHGQPTDLFEKAKISMPEGLNFTHRIYISSIKPKGDGIEKQLEFAEDVMRKLVKNNFGFITNFGVYATQ